MPMDERLRQLVTTGKDHYDRGEYDKAEPYLRQALQLGPGFADVHNMLGVICHDQGRFAQAQECFEIALRINPGYTEAALNLAVTYNDLGRYREAKEVYAQAVATSRAAPGQLDPFARGKLANMHGEIGAAYYGLGLLEEAIREYKKALELAPHFPDVRTHLAQALCDLSRLDEALDHLIEARRVNPRYTLGRVHLGLTLWRLGRRDEAAAEWEAVLAEDPTNKSCRMYLQMARTTGAP